MQRQDLNLDYGEKKSSSKEGSTAKKALLTMAKDLYNLYLAINDNDDLPEWCHYKLATSRKDLSDVTNYLTSKITKMCLDRQINHEDLREHINNIVAKEIIEESLDI